MKTPLQELIDEFDKMLITTTDPSKRSTILDCRRKATYFIEVEKKMVVDTFDSGFSDGILKENCITPDSEKGEEYYNEKFSK